MSESGITVLNKEEQTVDDSLKTLVKTLEAIDWKSRLVGNRRRLYST